MPQSNFLLKLFTLAVVAFMNCVGLFAQDTSRQLTQDLSVKLSILVTDEKGQFADDVRKEEVHVFEDDKEQEIVSFAKDESPLSYGLIVDNSSSLRSKISSVIVAAKSFVKNNRKEDETFIVRFVSRDQIQVMQDFTSNEVALNDALDQMFVQNGGTAVIDAVYLAADHLAKQNAFGESKGRRRVLILLTDGDDRSSYYKLDDLLKQLQETDIQIFPVGFVGVLSNESGFISPSKRKNAITLLNRLAEETGGLAFFPKDLTELKNDFGEIMRHLRARFVVEYKSSPVRKEKDRRKIQVTIADTPGRGKRMARTLPKRSVSQTKKKDIEKKE